MQLEPPRWLIARKVSITVWSLSACAASKQNVPLRHAKCGPDSGQMRVVRRVPGWCVCARAGAGGGRAVRDTVVRAGRGAGEPSSRWAGGFTWTSRSQTRNHEGASLAAPTPDAACRPQRKTSRRTRRSASAPGAAQGICAASRSSRRPTARPAESRSGTAAHSEPYAPMRRCRNGCWALSPSGLAPTVGSARRLAPAYGSGRRLCCSAAQMSWDMSMGSETQAPRARRNRRGARLMIGCCSSSPSASWATTRAAR